MTRGWTVAVAAAVAAVASGPALAQTEAEALAALEEALPGALVNNPFEATWQMQGQDARARVDRVDDIPGGSSFGVNVRRTKPNNWDIAANAPVTGGVGEGDVILIAF